MIRQRGLVAALVAASLGLLVACDAGAPIPSEAAPAVSEPSDESSPSRPIGRFPTTSETPLTGGLRDELEIGSLDPALTHPVLEFASDGESIVFSSGVAPDSGPDGAPDLWRFVPGPSAVPELLWRNPNRNHSLVAIGGDLGTIAFVDIPLDGSRAWSLWLIPGPGENAILLDQHPGDPAVSSLVPSFSVYGRRIVWSAFDRGADGAVSQLLVAEGPDWRPRVLLERSAAEAELWLPSLVGGQLAFAEVRYARDRSTDERFVYLMDLARPEGARRLDTSGRATMPLLVDGAVVWKEADAGFNMFNWGRLYRYALSTGRVTPLSTRPEKYVNYPSAGGRFIAWWGADAFAFSVYDLVRDHPRLVERHTTHSRVNVLRPHVSGDFIVWLHAEGDEPGAPSELRYAYLPSAAADRNR